VKRKKTRTATRAEKHVANVSVNTPDASGYAAVPVVGALTLREACIYLSVSEPTMYRLLERGLIRSNRMTRLHLFPVSELDRALREGMTS
jgi:excisionase family DNA binding protein